MVVDDRNVRQQGRTAAGSDKGKGGSADWAAWGGAAGWRGACSSVAV